MSPTFSTFILMKYGVRPFARSPNRDMSASAPLSIAVTVIARVPFFLAYSKGRTALSPTLSPVPGVVTSPADWVSPPSLSPPSALGLAASGVGAAAVGDSFSAAPSSLSPPHAVSPRPRVVTRAAVSAIRA